MEQELFPQSRAAIRNAVLDEGGGHIAHDQLPYATPPFSYEFIESREKMKWRVRDAKDNAMGSAETEEVAQFICDHLNGLVG